MPVKVTLYLSSDKYSWSEDHYYLASSAFNAATLPALQLMGFRAPCLGAGASVRLARLSTVPANGFVYDAIPGAPIAPSWPALATNFNQIFAASRPYQALQVRISSYLGQHRNYFMGGAPAGLFHGNIPGDTGLDFSGVGDFNTRLSNYLNFLSGGSLNNPVWGWLTRTIVPYSQSLGLVTNAAYPGMVGITVNAGLPGANVGSQVQVKGWRRISVKSGARLTGVYRVGAILPPVAPATVWTYFLLATSQVVPTNFFTLGQIAVYAPVPAGYFLTQSIQATERKRGATAYRPRGRARPR